MSEVLSDKISLANAIGVPVSELKASAEIFQQIVSYIGQKKARVEGEALKTFTGIYTSFIKANTENYKIISEILDKEFSKIDQRSVDYITKMLVEIEKLNLSQNEKIDLMKYTIDKRTEIEKLEKEKQLEIAKVAMFFGGSMALAALIFVGYKWARPKTFGDFLNDIFS